MSDSDSNSDTSEECRPTDDEQDPWPTPLTGKKTALTLPWRIRKLNNKDLRALCLSQEGSLSSTQSPPSSTHPQLSSSTALIQHRAKARYGDEAKEIQISAVVNLVRRRNTFVLAGTGYGKSRIAEMYWDLFPNYKKAIVLSLNPLDTLGDNQVEEKAKAKKPISAVNLTKMNLNEIMDGKYAFIYLSPEVLLNNSLFDELFFNSKFRDPLILTVVDEAHMVYMWGLVASGKAKKMISHLKHQDQAIFQPSYGKLARKLVLTNGVPILLLSATCRPVAVKGILKSLKLTHDNVAFLRAELTRPEIRILRIPMASSFKSCDDLHQLFGPKEHTPDKKVVPSLVYLPTRSMTMQGLKVINTSRGNEGGHHDPNSHFARHYHSCTGDLTKVDVIDDFSSDQVAVISCTMALGLGQNWKRVRMVAHLGRGDPASLFQMIGRCGRDGRPGLSILFVEPHRRNGKNSVDDFEDDEPMDQTEYDRMDALAITPVCLRVAFSLDNLLGYIPLKLDDPNVILEKERETKAGFAECGCSNCKVEETSVIIRNLKHLDVNNFTSFLERPTDIPTPIRSDQSAPTGSSDERNSGACLVAEFTADEVFSLKDARAAVLATEKGFQKESLEAAVGGELNAEWIKMLHICIEDYVRSKAYKEYRLQATKKKQTSHPQSHIPVPEGHLDPLLFQLTSVLHQGPKKTKKQQAAEESKKRTAAKREMKKAQKAVDGQKKKEAKKKQLEAAKKREENERDKENKTQNSAKRKASREAEGASKAKLFKRAQVELDRFHSGTT
ncbi:hypothetical protein MJO28_016943 [Puccinia striiformis f. sp. tritici]|nr:hypothetical protein MJO28_016943 [Puccinia striiformis f. sp. tritici]